MEDLTIKPIHIANKITRVGAYTFNGLSAVTEVFISDTVTTIDATAFTGCTGIKTIIYDGVEEPTTCIDAFKHLSNVKIIVRDEYEGETFCGKNI